MLSKRLACDAPLEALTRAPIDSPPELDARALAQLRELDPKGENRLIERVLGAFRNSAARLLPQFVEARRTGNRATLRLVAHTFKSSAGSIGALTLAQCCARAEAAVCNEDRVDLDPELDAMTAALLGALQAIERHLDPAT